MFPYEDTYNTDEILQHKCKVYKDFSDEVQPTIVELKNMKTVVRFGCLNCRYLTHDGKKCFRFSYSLRAINNGVSFYSRNHSYIGETTGMQECLGFEYDKGRLL